MEKSVLTVRPWKPPLSVQHPGCYCAAELTNTGDPRAGCAEIGCLEEVEGGRDSMAGVDRVEPPASGELGERSDTHLERGEGQVQLAFLLASGGWLTLLMFIYLAGAGS